MDKIQIFDILKANALSVLPHLDEAIVTENASLRALGANSMDRAEIIMMTLQDINLRAPMMDFASATNIDGICRIMEKKVDNSD
jgi:polyketide biosynthesis acyl carrier protein